jgi:hypothetical protein
MYPVYNEHSTLLRKLSPDDIAGICAIYPPGPAIPASCDDTPRHGFSVLCAADQPPAKTGCSASPAGSQREGAPYGGMLAAMGALLLGVRSRRGTPPRPRSRGRRRSATQ